MANAYTYSNVALATTLAGSISAGATTATVAATTGFPGTYPFVLAFDYGASTEELVLVTAVAGTNLTVTRAFGGTSAQSHSLGAVVRHVINAVDLTDFRTHEAATSGVHGVTGTLVGTSDSQTLANKTLTSPTINSGALSGTFTGAHTYSGAVTLSAGGTLGGTFTGAHTYSGAVTLSGGGTLTGTFTGSPTLSGTVNHTGIVQSTQSLSNNVSLATIVTADSFDRFRLYASGMHEWGSGALTRDTNLYRSAADVLKTDDSFHVGGTALLLGSAGDVNLYRSAADTLSTDDSLTVAGTLTNSTAAIPYKPVQSGTVSFSFTTQTSSTSAVVFGTAFAANPRVVCNINSTSGSTLQWSPKAGGISTSGFTLIVSGPAATWSSVEVQWVAFQQ